MGRGRSLPRAVCFSFRPHANSQRWPLRRLRRGVPGGTHYRQARQPRLVPAVRAGCCEARTVPSSSRHARRARAVSAKAAPRSTPQPSSFTTDTGAGREHQRGRVSEPPGITGLRQSGTSGRVTRQRRTASRFHDRCPPGGPSPLFPERPNSAVHPLQPAIIRAELPCATAARTTPLIGVPLRVYALAVEGASWPSFLVLSRGDGPPGG